MALATGVRGQSKTRISYQLIRNVTSPEEKENGIATYFANVPAFELERIDTADNLRDYIPGSDFEAIKNTKRNSVHKAIAGTIESEPDRFINRNGGVTITCAAIEVDDKAQTVNLVDASIVNGAQTRGEILRYRANLPAEEGGEEGASEERGSPFHVRAEIIVDPDHASVIETAIARNTASPVKSISQAGGRGQLDELNAVVLAATGKPIKKSETDEGDAFDTFHILQITRLLMPASVSKNDTPSEVLKPYKQRAQCLDDFTRWYATRHSDEDDNARYQFTLQMAVAALKEFAHWQEGDMWNGKKIRTDGKKGRAFRRDKRNGNIVWVAPGVVFPIMGALRNFVHQDKKRVWKLVKPSVFEQDELVNAALEQYRGHDTNPMWMGRSAAAYSALAFITRTYQRAEERLHAT